MRKARIKSASLNHHGMFDWWWQVMLLCDDARYDNCGERNAHGS